MVITNAKYVETDNGDSSTYVSIRATINGTTYSIPIAADNTDYAEILRRVAAGTLTIEDAD